jgi:hypothetical protein
MRMTDSGHAHLPTVAELARMSDEELRDHHDAQVGRAAETGEPVSDLYLGELGVRMAELRDERVLRILLVVLAVSAAALLVSVFGLVVAL